MGTCLSFNTSVKRKLHYLPQQLAVTQLYFNIFFLGIILKIMKVAFTHTHAVNLLITESDSKF